MRKLERGGTEHSFGIHVAQIAGMPPSIVKRAQQILSELENNSNKKTLKGENIQNAAQKRSGMQLSIFQLDDPALEQIRDEIKNVDINNLTPIEALNKLAEIKKIINGH